MSGGVAVAVRVLLGAASGNPLAPFVIGEEGADEEKGGDDDEDKLHGGLNHQRLLDIAPW